MVHKRLALSQEDYDRLNHDILTNIEALDAFQQARHVALYVSCRNEVRADALIARHPDKTFGVPKVTGDDMVFYDIMTDDDLEPGCFGVREPKEGCALSGAFDLMLVPLLMFDKNHNRIGYGRGFYDRYFKDHPVRTIGLAYGFQEVADTCPHEGDVPLDLIMTEEGLR